MSPDIPQTITPSTIGEAVRAGLSPWHIKLSMQGFGPYADRQWVDAARPVGALPARTGDAFEAQVYEWVDEHARIVKSDWGDDPATELQNALDVATGGTDGDDPIACLQVPLDGHIGAFDVSGDADLLFIWPGTVPELRVIDVKGSWEESPHQQMQVATYTTLLSETLRETPRCRISGGIIHRDTVLDPPTPTTVPVFDHIPRETDLSRLLSADGPIRRALETEFEDLPLTIDDATQHSPFAELYNVVGVESASLGVIGLSGSEQALCERHGIETLSDLAALVERPSKPRAYEFDDPRPVDADAARTIRALDDDGALHTRTAVLAQHAQAYLSRLDPDHPSAHDGWWTPPIVGAGSGNLPDDNPRFDADLGYERGSLIRCYLNVQYDYVRDQLVLAAGRVDSDQWVGGPLTVSELVDDIPDDYDDTSAEEAMLDTFFDELFKRVELIADQTNHGEQAPVHFYVYSDAEREALLDAVARHDTGVLRAARDLLGMRAGIEQPMLSVVESEFTERYALKQPCSGLLHMNDSTSQPYDDSGAEFSFEDWEYTTTADETVDLRDAFRYQLFDYRVPYSRSHDEERAVTFGIGEDVHADDFFPIRARTGAQIPLEYIWACDPLAAFGPEWGTDDDERARINKYCWDDGSLETHRITGEDVCTLAEKFAHVLHNLERGIDRNHNVEKAPLPVDDLASFSLDDATLASATRDFLDLEHRTTVEDLKQTYEKPLEQRIRDGNAAPIRIEAITEERDWMFKAKGALLYDEFDFEDPDRVALASRLKGGGDGSSGSFVVATPLHWMGDSFEQTESPRYIERQATAVSIDDFDPRSNTVTISGYRSSGYDEMRYVSSSRKKWEVDPNRTDYATHFMPGDTFVLDESCDDSNANKSLVALRNAEQNELYRLLARLRVGDDTDLPLAYDYEAGVEEYLDWVEQTMPFGPNDRQREFITETDARLSVLQGPPGTGKTSGALAHTLVSRAYAKGVNEDSVRTAVFGASHTSVDEVLEDTAHLVHRVDDDTLGDAKLFRITYDPPAPADRLKGVTYVNPNQEGIVRILEQHLDRDAGTQTTLGSHSTGGGASPHIFVFGTAGGIQKLVSKFERFDDLETWYQAGTSLFDVMAADEASMLPLWQLFLVGSFLDEDGQTLLVGDHRQMPPISSYDWSSETRRSITDHLPYLSCLDYARFLRGDDVRAVETAAVEPATPAPGVDIPMARLETTYRCHTDIAEFLRTWVYENDGIPYRSEETETIPPTNASTPGLAAAVTPAPLTLVAYDDERSRQSNFVEAELIDALVSTLPQQLSVGVVTPHNAQKGLLRSRCGTQADIDTVERFQGGQRDVMILSVTVSDPKYMDSVADFLFDVRRLNVALSRMKQKLIVVAPWSVFRALPDDLDSYEQTLIWKGLATEVNASRTGPSDWDGDLTTFVGRAVGPSFDDVSVRVFDNRPDTN
jgi:uncharacterized protein